MLIYYTSSLRGCPYPYIYQYVPNKSTLSPVRPVTHSAVFLAFNITPVIFSLHYPLFGLFNFHSNFRFGDNGKSPNAYHTHTSLPSTFGELLGLNCSTKLEEHAQHLMVTYTAVSMRGKLFPWDYALSYAQGIGYLWAVVLKYSPK